MSNAINQKDLNVMCATTAVQNASEARLTLTNTLIADWIFMMCLSQMCFFFLCGSDITVH